jgi:cytochrome c
MRARARSLAIAGIVLTMLGVGGVLVAGAQMAASKQQEVARALTGGEPARGPDLIRRYGCGGCHTISAVRGADGEVAPPLDQLRKRVYIGGVLENSPDALVRWIASPRSFSPNTAMPSTGISEAEARHVAAFLYSH